MLIAGAELEGKRVDVRCAGGVVREIAAELRPAPGEAVLRARGGALLPGLHDHHTHLFALAAAGVSVRCGPPEVRDREALARALRAAHEQDGWVRGVGYHESVAGWLDRDALDRIEPTRPLRVQHRGGALWMLNSPALELLGADRQVTPDGVERGERGRATGRLFRCDAWLRERLGGDFPPLAPLGARLARMGITGVTDATATNGATALGALCAAQLPQELWVMGSLELSPPARSRVRIGPHKILLDEGALPDPDRLAKTIARAHALGRRVAIHCVTRAELVLAASALRAAGPLRGDRIEHASVAPPPLTQLIAELGLWVVTQPGFIRERGDDYARDVEPADRPWLYRCAAFDAAGVPLGAGTDAPFGDPDPWRAMRAAVERRTRDGLELGPGEAISPERALALFTTPAEAPGDRPRRVLPGHPADLCLLDRPWREARRELSSGAVLATLCAGELAWLRDAQLLG